jgi:hypothetical protein
MRLALSASITNYLQGKKRVFFFFFFFFFFGTQMQMVPLLWAGDTARNAVAPYRSGAATATVEVLAVISQANVQTPYR